MVADLLGRNERRGFAVVCTLKDIAFNVRICGRDGKDEGHLDKNRKFIRAPVTGRVNMDMACTH